MTITAPMIIGPNEIVSAFTTLINASNNSSSGGGSTTLTVDYVSTAAALGAYSGTATAVVMANYATAGDGGGGLFYISSTIPSGFAVDNGIIFAVGSKYAIRICDYSTLNVAWYGVVPGVVSDCANALTAMQTFLVTYHAIYGSNNLSGGAIHFNVGNYYFSKFTIASGMTLEGCGSQSTILYAYSTTISSPQGMIQCGGGPIEAVTFRGFSLYGGTTQNAPTNIGQHGMYFYAQTGNGYNFGGLNYASFEDVSVQWFTGYQLALRGDNGSSGLNLLPHQWLTFKKCRFFNSVQVIFTAGIAANSNQLIVTGTPTSKLFVGMSVYCAPNMPAGVTITAAPTGNLAGTYTLSASIGTTGISAGTSMTATYPNSRSVLITGQVQHVTFENCQLDGYDINTTTTPIQVPNSINVEMGPEYNNGTIGYCGPSVGGTATGANAPNVTTFNQCTCQSNQIGMYFYTVTAIVILGGDFEHLYGCFFIGTQSQVSITGANFGNCAASYPAGNGYIYNIGAGVLLTYSNMFYNNNTLDNYIINSSSNGIAGRYSKNNRFSGSGIGTTVNNLDTLLNNSGGTIQLTPSSGAINLITNSIPYVGNTFIVNGYSTIALAMAAPITTINSFMETGERLHLQAFGGTLFFQSGGNIYLGDNIPSVLVPSGLCLTLVRFDLGPRWLIQGGPAQFSIGEYTIAGLPSATNLPDGVWAYVTNGLVSTGWGNTPSATGSARLLVRVCNGAWLYG